MGRRRRASPGITVRLERAVLIWVVTFAVGLLLGLLVGFLLGRISAGNGEEAAPPLSPGRTVTVEKPVPAPEKTIPAPEKTVPATTATATAKLSYGYSFSLIIGRNTLESFAFLIHQSAWKGDSPKFLGTEF